MVRLVLMASTAAYFTACKTIDHEGPQSATVSTSDAPTISVPQSHQAAAGVDQLERHLVRQTSLLSQLGKKVDRLSNELNDLEIHQEIRGNEVAPIYSQIDPHPSKPIRIGDRIKRKPDTRPPTATIEGGRDELLILGAVEKVSFRNLDKSFDARVDTGAATSSLNAIKIEEFERNGKKWVRFQLEDGQTANEKPIWLEAPVQRAVKIRQQTSGGVPQRRLVVSMWVRVGPIEEQAEFTLADRTMMSNPVLLGREFIKDIALVDVSSEYILSTEP